MSDERLIKQSIDKRLEEERYVIPKEKKKRKSWFNPQYIIIASILISLFFTLLRVLAYFGG